MDLSKYKSGQCVRLTAVESAGLLGVKFESLARLTGKSIQQIILEHAPKQVVLILDVVTATSITGTDVETIEEVSFEVFAGTLRHSPQWRDPPELRMYDNFFGWTIASVGTKEARGLIKKRVQKLQKIADLAAENVEEFERRSQDLFHILDA